MPVATQRATLADLVRALTIAALAVVQVVVSGLGGSGAIGDPVGEVANDYATPILAAGWAFAIWGPIYVGFLAYAGYQLLPAQRTREVHRETGWWLAASAVLNPLWVLAFGARLILLAEVLIVALLVCLAVVLARLSRTPAEGVVERAVFRGPIALYTGWVSLATVLGTAATGVWAGLPGTGALAAVVSVLVLLVASAIVASVVTAGTQVVPYAAAAVWALAGIAANGPPAAVVAAALVAIVVVGTATARRIGTAGNRVRAAWG
ncbi:MAG TPA: tryptophan-rich sensory protein [Pseudonocardia sp.]|nr:tryptophan-rich sensory protein [Pseudonocardia sp.]